MTKRYPYIYKCRVTVKHSAKDEIKIICVDANNEIHARQQAIRITGTTGKGPIVDILSSTIRDHKYHSYTEHVTTQKKPHQQSYHSAKKKSPGGRSAVYLGE